MRKLTIAAASAVIAASLLAGPAQALPAANLADVSAELASVQKTAWVCGPYRCWWQPNYYAYNYAPVVVAPRVIYPAYGYYGYRPYAYTYRRAWAGPGWRYRRGWW
jgi:hypothetical protein